MDESEQKVFKKQTGIKIRLICTAWATLTDLLYFHTDFIHSWTSKEMVINLKPNNEKSHTVDPPIKKLNFAV